MKTFILLSLCLLTMGLFAQQAQLKTGIRTSKYHPELKLNREVEKPAFSLPAPRSLNNLKSDNPSFVNVITLGTSANANTYGYNGGQKTMLWADDTLKGIVNIHRMGPGSNPPGLSGFLAVDKALNMGQNQSDWTNNWQIYASTLNLGGQYYADAARYPQAVLHNPAGNTDPANTYIGYFGPNTSHNSPLWGGYSYGVCNFVNQGDSTKHLYWFSAPPWTYIPDGMTITHKDVTMLTDLEREYDAAGTFVAYHGNLVFERGVWDDVAKDFVYTLSTIPCPSIYYYPSDDRIAASPDGNIVWIATINDNNDFVQLMDSSYYLTMFKSNDGGLTWSSPIAVQLDGPNGIAGVKDYLSDYRITQLFNPPYPTRDQIPFTTAWDLDLVVDKWGNPHVGVIIGVAGSQGYSIVTGSPGDSCMGVFDIYQESASGPWHGQLMGRPWNFAADYGNNWVEYNRVNAAVNETGDHVFFTWNDTQLPGQTDNKNPDVFARGFDLLTVMITKNKLSGLDEPDNVTFLSDVTNEATCEVTSHYVFTDGDNHIIPIAVELMTNQDPTLEVEFRYISDFSYGPDDYTIVGITDKHPSPENATIRISPNPFSGTATATVELKKQGNVRIELFNTMGQKLMSMDKGQLNAGKYSFTIDGSRLKSGVYFCIVNFDSERYTQKVIVK